MMRLSAFLSSAYDLARIMATSPDLRDRRHTAKCSSPFFSRFSPPASTRPDLIPLLGCHAFRWPCGGKGQYGNIITRRWSIGDSGRKKRARVSGTDRCRTERKAKDLLYMVGEERRDTGEEEELLLQLSVACMCVWKNGEDALLCLSQHFTNPRLPERHNHFVLEYTPRRPAG
jgi:hypothetical protein